MLLCWGVAALVSLTSSPYSSELFVLGGGLVCLQNDPPPRTYSVSSLHWIIEIYHNSLQDWAQNSSYFRLYRQPTTTQQCSMYCGGKHILRTVNNVTFYVYWTVHHLHSWIKRDQLDVTCFIISSFNAQHVSDVNTSILRSLRPICWVISWLYWSGSMCVGVTLWFGCGGVVSVRRLRHCFSLHTDTTPPQPNHNVTPTHIEPEQYNPWYNSAHKSQAPEDGCIDIRNMLSIK